MSRGVERAVLACGDVLKTPLASMLLAWGASIAGARACRQKKYFGFL